MSAGYTGYGQLVSVLGRRPRVGYRRFPAGWVNREAGEVAIPVADRVVEREAKKRKSVTMDQGEYAREKRVCGRAVRRKTNFYTRKLVAGAVQRLTFGFEQTSSFGGLSGAEALDNYVDGGPYIVPCHVYDLTACRNTYNGTTYNAQCGYAPVFSNNTATGSVRWQTLGNAVNVINIPNTSVSTASLVGQRSILRSIKAKMLFYCPTTIPTRVLVQIVQFTDQRLCPRVSGATVEGLADYQSPGYLLPSGLAEYQDDFTSGFWRDMVHPFAKNPTCQVSSGSNKYMKTLFSHSFIMNPKESTEATATKYHQLDIFHRLNRTCNYQWDDPSSYAPQTDDATGQVVANTRCTVHPRARLFLIVRAISGYSATAHSTTIHPSYDITMRMHHDDMGA